MISKVATWHRIWDRWKASKVIQVRVYYRVVDRWVGSLSTGSLLGCGSKGGFLQSRVYYWVCGPDLHVSKYRKPVRGAVRSIVTTCTTLRSIMALDLAKYITEPCIALVFRWFRPMCLMGAD